MKILDYTKLTDQKWLNLFNVAYRDRFGNHKAWQLASRQATPKCVSGQFEPADAVLVVAQHMPSGKLVLIHEFRVALGGFEYGLAAGLVDPGETIAEAAKRELKEETGLDLTRVVRISPPIYSSTGMSDESVALVYVECDGEPSDVDNQGSELIEVVLVTPQEARALVDDQEIMFDAKAWIVADNYARNGQI